jgi:hypothetical protein
MSAAAAPVRRSASVAPASRRSVMKALKRATMMRELHARGIELRFPGWLTPVLVVAEDCQIAEAAGNLKHEEARAPIAVSDLGDEGEALGAGGFGHDVGVIDFDDHLRAGMPSPMASSTPESKASNLQPLERRPFQSSPLAKPRAEKKSLERLKVFVAGGHDKAMK